MNELQTTEGGVPIQMGEDGIYHPVTAPDVLNILHHFPHREGAKIGSISAPSVDDLAVINTTYAQAPLVADDVAVFTVFLANNQVDRDQERFSENTLARLRETLPGKSFLMAHQWGPPGVARFFAANLVREDDGVWLVGKIYLLRKWHEQMIDEVNAGTWWAVSIGFRWAVRIPIGEDGKPMDANALQAGEKPKFWEFQEDPEAGRQSESYEGSLVYLGAQYGAAMGRASKGAASMSHLSYQEMLRSDGVKIDGRPAPETIKGVIPFKHHDLAPESQAWDGPGEVAKAEPKDLKEMCAWVDSEKPDLKGSYKFPHHTLSGYKTVWKGCAAGMARLNQADISAADKTGVFNHLAKHYVEFDKKPPKMIEGGEFKIEEEDENMVIEFVDDKKTAEPAAAPAQTSPVVLAQPAPPAAPAISVDGKSLEGLTASIAQATASMNAAVTGLNAKVDTVASSLKATQDRLDAGTDRKGRAMEPDAEGFIKLPVTGAAMGGIKMPPEEDCAKIFRVDAVTKLPSDESIAGFMTMIGLKSVDMTVHAKNPVAAEKVKQTLKSNIAALINTAVEYDLFRR